MAYEVISKGEQVTLSTETGNDGTLADKTACLSDGSSATSCVEVKIGQGIRAEWSHAPAAMSSATIRIGVESIMNEGTLRVAPYTDSNSISDTNGATTGTITGGGDEDRTVTASFISDVGTTDFTFRVFENGSAAKIKTAELSVQATVATINLTGVTKDKDGVALGSVFVHLFRKVSGSGPWVWAYSDNQTSNASTGAYDFAYEDRGEEQMVVFFKDDTPHVMDCTDHVLTGS